MKSKFKQNIGMSVNIAVVDTVQKQNKIKLLNREVKIENYVPENKTKNKVQVKTKYWHECLHCSH